MRLHLAVGRVAEYSLWLVKIFNATLGKPRLSLYIAEDQPKVDTVLLTDLLIILILVGGDDTRFNQNMFNFYNINFYDKKMIQAANKKIFLTKCIVTGPQCEPTRR